MVPCGRRSVASVNLPTDASGVGLALLQGGLVALPRPQALAPLGRLRSPAWAAVLPGAVLLGTFGPLSAPSTAVWLPVVAALVAPPLAGVAALAVVRSPRASALALALVATVLAAVAGGLVSELSASVITVLACLALGATLARLIPVPWMLAGVLSMALVDVALFCCGAGQAPTPLIPGTTSPHGALFDGVRIGQLAIDYPDLVLAATLGAFLADQRDQRLAAVLVAALAASCFVLTPWGGIWPATVPIAVTLLALRTVRLPRIIARSRRGLRSRNRAGARARGPRLTTTV